MSAGYDAAIGDDLGKMKVSPAGYAHMTHLLSALAGGKIVLALEGGYNVDSVVKSSHACVEILVGDEPPYLPSLGAASLGATNTVHDVMRMQSTYWKSMGTAVATSEGTIYLPVLPYNRFHSTDCCNKSSMIELKKAGKTVSLTGKLTISS